MLNLLLKANNPVIAFKELAINIPRPSSGTSEVAYQLDKTFFGLFENSLVENGQLAVHIKLVKNATQIQLLFDIQGAVELTCDRTLAPFNYPIAITQTVYFKFGQETKELDVDLYMIEQGATTIDVAQHIYDFVSLAVPMKKLHPQLRDQE